MFLILSWSCLCPIHWSQVLSQEFKNEDVVGAAPTGAAPTTSEWPASLLPTKVWLILDVWWCICTRIRSSFVQIIACCLISHCLNQCCLIVNNYWTLSNQHQWHLNQNTANFHLKNVLEVFVIIISIILLRPQCVKHWQCTFVEICIGLRI